MYSVFCVYNNSVFFGSLLQHKFSLLFVVELVLAKPCYCETLLLRNQRKDFAEKGKLLLVDIQ